MSINLSRFMGGPISRWFCAVHPNEFLVFRYGYWGAPSYCLKCRGWGCR